MYVLMEVYALSVAKVFYYLFSVWLIKISLYVSVEHHNNNTAILCLL